jgi:hypothetical protein
MQLDEIIIDLLKEFKDQRDKIKEMVVEVEDLQEQVSLLFPDKVDARTRKFLEDKVKTMVAFYNVLLDMRKEISKSVKEELDFRRRLENEEFDPEDLSELLDVSELSKKVDQFLDKKTKLRDKRIKESKGLAELEEKGIEIPGLKELKEEEEGD